MIAAGGTAGHVVPAIAVADALRAEGAEVTFVGGERAEAELVPAGRLRARPRSTSRASAAPTRSRPPARVGKAGVAVRQRAQASSSAAQADAVLGGGGYVAGPVGLAAALTQDPARARPRPTPPRPHQPRARAAAPAASAWRSRSTAATGERYLVTGRPVPPDVTDRAQRPRAARDRRRTRRCVLVFGGSLGARSINDAAPSRRSRTRPTACVHVAGTRDYPDLRQPGPHYVLLDYLTPFGVALAAADVAVARAGGSVFELAQYGLPAVLIPYPHASADHQTANARWMARRAAPPSSSPTPS